MSRERMLDLRRILISSGWEVFNEAGVDLPLDVLFEVEAECVKWQIRHSKNRLQIPLVFRLAGELGNPTDDVRHVFYCDAIGHDLRLYFSKINTEVWRRESKEFVESLNSMLQ